MLFTGPRHYLRPTDGALVVGSSARVIHSGKLDEPLQLPRNLSGLWILEVTEPNRTSGALTALRVFGHAPSKNTLSSGIRAATTVALPTLIAAAQPGLEGPGHDL